MKKLTFTLPVFLFLFPYFTNGQQALQLAACETVEYEINDHSDSDNDGIVCEAKISISNSAYYTDNEVCDLSNIKWTVQVDLDGDGVNDIEYNSNLPSDDVTLDDTNNNGIPDLYIPTTLNNEMQIIQLPDIEGPSNNHKISWLVSDDCDLGDLCVTNFSVADKKAPTPYCIPFEVLTHDGTDFEILADNFNIGSFDNCTAIEDVRISFSGDSIVPTRMVTCDDVLNSSVELRMYAWDDYDNVDYCTFYLTVVPGANTDCFPFEDVITGVVRTCDGKPIEGVEVTLDANLIEYPRVDVTDEEGRYSFGSVQNGFNYSLSASFENDYREGVSTLDLVLIVRHILGLQPFTEPCKIIAADINGDYQIKANDLLSLRKLILGIINEFPSNTSWKFLDAKFEFENPTDPFFDIINADSDPFLIEFNQIDPEGYDFIGIKVGNVSN